MAAPSPTPDPNLFPIFRALVGWGASQVAPTRPTSLELPSYSLRWSSSTRCASPSTLASSLRPHSQIIVLHLGRPTSTARPTSTNPPPPPPPSTSTTSTPLHSATIPDPYRPHPCPASPSEFPPPHLTAHPVLNSRFPLDAAAVQKLTEHGGGAPFISRPCCCHSNPRHTAHPLPYCASSSLLHLHSA